MTTEATSIELRAEHLHAELQSAIHERTDRLFAWLMLFQWIGAIIAALLISPLTWSGASSQMHPHVPLAILLGSLIVSLPIGLAVLQPGHVLTRHTIGVGQMLMSALLIHLSGGRIETHFHVFGSLAFLAFYRDWWVLASASLVVGVDHFVRGVFWPQSVFGVTAVSDWRWLEHVGWVVFEDIFLFAAIRQSVLEMRVNAEKQARIERTNQQLEREVTERKRVEGERERLLECEKVARQDAEKANRVKDEFLATLSHELRTPLMSILGWSRILCDDHSSSEQLDKGLEVIERNARHQTQMIEDLLDVSRIINGKLCLETQPVNFERVVESALETVRPAATARRIQIHKFLRPLPNPILGDANRLQQIVWNVLSNAVKFTQLGGEIHVELEANVDQALLTVRDNGRGIASEFLPHVFERFRQADSSSTRANGGLGLGLAIVRHITELHGGVVGVASDGVGKGSTFTVSLPLATQTDVMKSTIHVRREDVSRQLDGLSVMVVEDDADARSLVEAILVARGAKIQTASSVREALVLLDRSPAPDVLISDIAMPEEDGFALLRTLRRRETTSGGYTPVAALTAAAKPEDRARILSAGFEIHLSKPVEPGLLAAAVAKLALQKDRPAPPAVSAQRN